jgi:anaerobic ribonucleoside-triphosphate reductase activating protein
MNFHGLEKDSMLNGDGLRVVLWVSGCENKCKGCQNPQTWPLDSGKEFKIEDEMDLYIELGKPHISGITFSGGDPLHPDNRETIGKLIMSIKSWFPSKTIWLYTGYRFEDIMCLPFIWLCDVIVDGKFIEELKDVNYPWAGSTNQRVIRIDKLKQYATEHLDDIEY